MNAEQGNVGQISQLFIYPIKSCAGIPIDKAIVTSMGVAMVNNPIVRDRFVTYELQIKTPI